MLTDAGKGGALTINPMIERCLRNSCAQLEEEGDPSADQPIILQARGGECQPWQRGGYNIYWGIILYPWH
jgi:hypothetical protein